MFFSNRKRLKQISTAIVIVLVLSMVLSAVVPYLF